MTALVTRVDGEHRVAGDWSGVEPANWFLEHLRSRAFAPATVRAHAFDLVNLGRFLQQRSLGLTEVEPVDVFAWVDWQGVRRPEAGSVVLLTRSGSAPATVNRRVAAARAFFEFLVMSGRGSPTRSRRRAGGWDCARRRGACSGTSARDVLVVAGVWSVSSGGSRSRWS
jgi:hypothetical protein